MTEDEIKEKVRHALHLIAPEVDFDDIDPDAPLQEEIELDSMDFLRFMQQLHEDLGVDIPESDYDQVSTLNQCFNYLKR